jgi:hypothetical protein
MAFHFMRLRFSFVGRHRDETIGLLNPIGSTHPGLVDRLRQPHVSMGLTMTDFKDEPAECLRRALRYGSEAVATPNPILRDLLFDIEEQWRSLAESYRAAQRAIDAAIGAKRSLPHPSLRDAELKQRLRLLQHARRDDVLYQNRWSST